VIITTKRTILGRRNGSRGPRDQYRAGSAEIADTIARKLASMTTSSPVPHDKRPLSAEKCVEIEYLRGKMHRLNPMPLPPPALFFPPFSSSSSEVSDDDEPDTEDEEDSVDSVSAALISQRANPHHSDNTYPDNEELSSNDEEDEDDMENDLDTDGDDANFPRGRPADPRREISGSTRATAGKRVDAMHTGSSAATAGGAESGYNSSMEE
jgi:hypothetical protein